MIKMEWVEIIEDDYDTYPREGYNVLVCDASETCFDVAWYLMSSEYRWVKTDHLNNELLDFNQFKIFKWSYFE